MKTGIYIFIVALISLGTFFLGRFWSDLISKTNPQQTTNISFNYDKNKSELEKLENNIMWCYKNLDLNSKKMNALPYNPNNEHNHDKHIEIIKKIGASIDRMVLKYKDAN